MKVFQTSGVNSLESMQHADSTWLVPQCIAGNEEAIEYLFRQYEAGVFKLVLSIVDDPAEANEIAQETFIAALRGLAKYQEQKSFKAWLYAIAVNQSRSHLRKRRVLKKLENALTRIFRVELEKQVKTEEQVLQNEREVVLWKCINQMGEKHRIVLVLRYFHELSIHEISEILAINEGTIHSRLHNAREKLRSALEDSERD
jgi:RNA polymerase sigma-70 factor, ECF subfamily